MKITDIKGYIEFTVILVVAALTIVGINITDIDTVQLSAYAILFATAIISIYRFARYMHLKRLGIVAMSNLSVIKNSKRYCQVLLTFANVNEKKLLKNKDISKIKKIRDLERHLVKKIRGDDSNLKQKNKITLKIKKLKQNYSDANTLSLLKNLEPEQDYKVSQILSKTFTNLERTLLTADQFDLRIKFGKYIRTFSNDIIARIKAELDFIGWTYMMKGNLSKGEKSIDAGIKLAQEYLKDPEYQDCYEQLSKLIVRGYRHLGSARPTYETKPAVALTHLKIAKETLETIAFDENYTNEMRAGIDYGFLISELYLFKDINKKTHPTKNEYLKLLNNFKSFDNQLKSTCEFNNKHRYLKFIVLKSKYSELFISLYDQFSFHLGDKFNYSKADLKVIMDDSLNRSKNILDNNIFIDEAIEYYLESSVQNLKFELITEIGG